MINFLLISSGLTLFILYEMGAVWLSNLVLDKWGKGPAMFTSLSLVWAVPVAAFFSVVLAAQ